MTQVDLCPPAYVRFGRGGNLTTLRAPQQTLTITGRWLVVQQGDEVRCVPVERILQVVP